MAIVKVTADTVAVWAQFCHDLWPHNTAAAMRAEWEKGLLPHEYLYEENGDYIAFVSLALRHDYVEGKTDENPVGYLEAIYVVPEHRRRGIARALVGFAEAWSRAQGCTMLASDCELPNEQSRAFHNRVGFAEESINVHFSMALGE